MKRNICITTTDQINLSNILIPANVLAHSIERAFNEADAVTGFGGFPTYISHDWTRPIGWNIPLGLHLAAGIARQIGELWWPETSDEKAACQDAQTAFLERLRVEKAAQYGTDLLARVGTDGANASIVYVAGGAALYRPDLARTLYPHLFEVGTDTVDKDGLVDYRYLRSRYPEMRPGIFHDPEKDVVLFAHPYLRRSLSRLNVLNNDLLTRLAALAESELSVTLRLRIDPDIVGYPDARAALELEFWRGPKFTDDIGKIPAGVTEHKASDRLKEFEGIDRTQFWWKTEDEHKRTFEAEEIRDTPSLGVSNDYYGCRYMHSEFGTREETITHFDGAIRGYDTEAFVTRIDQSIDRAGKRADYTKLFRVDGGLTVELWKELASDYFRGNTLVPEYFGSPPQRDETNRAQPRAAPVSETTGQLMIGYLDRTAITASDCTALISFDLVAQDDGPAQFRVFEALPPGIAEAFSSFSEYTNGAQIEYGDRLANLPVLVFGQANEATQEFSHWCACIARVLSKERENLELAAAAFMWPRERYWVMLSLCGDIAWLIEALGQLPTVVRTQEPPSVWVQDLKAKLASSAQSNGKIADIDDVRWPGFLKLRRTQSTASFRVPSGHPAFDFLNKKAAGPSGGDQEPRTEG